LTATAIADRVRWQLDGWLSGTAWRPDASGSRADARGSAVGGAEGWAARRSAVGGIRQGRPTAGILRLRLVPEGVLAHVGLQAALWGDAGEGRERAHRAFSRVQGMLGPDAVVTAVAGTGRAPSAVVRWVPWGDERVPPPTAPWPGRLSPPAPASVLPESLPAVVYDTTGAPVTVSARLAVSAPPAWLAIGTAGPVEITTWAGPWPVDERWWAAVEARRQARFEVCLVDGRALLLTLGAGRWQVEAIYD
jgi:protein ImuB